MILGIGEILVDIFESDSERIVLPGGAPFNVVSNTLSFNCKSSFYGVVGNDEYGKFLIDYANSRKFSNLYLDKNDNKQTTQALVTLKDGERNFRFVRDNGADYNLQIERIKQFDYSDIKIVHFGSLMLSHLSGRNFLKEAIKFYREVYPRIILSFDVNYREDIFANENESRNIYLEFIPLFDFVKISNDEVETLSGKSDVFSGLSSLTNKKQFVFLTCGKLGSYLLVNGNKYYSNSHPVKPVDTTGAGDAFYSYILAKMDTYDFDKLTKEEIENILFHANCVGALATLKKGAIDVVPSEEELERYILTIK